MASFLTIGYCKYICIYIYSYMCIFFPKNRMLPLYNYTCMHMFRADYLATGQPVGVLFPWVDHTLSPSFLRVPIVLCVGLRPHGLFSSVWHAHWCRSYSAQVWVAMLVSLYGCSFWGYWEIQSNNKLLVLWLLHSSLYSICTCIINNTFCAPWWRKLDWISESSIQCPVSIRHTPHLPARSSRGDGSFWASPHSPPCFASWDRMSCSSGWPWTRYVAKANLELVFFLPLPLKCWDHEHSSTTVPDADTVKDKRSRELKPHKHGPEASELSCHHQDSQWIQGIWVK